MQHKDFVAVLFQNKTHSVVPNHWLIEVANVLYCKWPPSNQDTLSLANTTACDSWPLSRVKKVLAESCKY